MEIAATTSTPTPDPSFHLNAAGNRQLAGAVQALNDAGAAGSGREFSFSIDPQTKQAVVRIVDANTRELVEQFPSQYILNVAQELAKNFALESSGAADKSFVETIA